MNPLKKAIKSIRDLGLPKLWYYTLYRIGLTTGRFHRLTPSKMTVFEGAPSLPPYSAFPKITGTHRDQLLEEADLVRKNIIHLFGAHRVALDLHIGASQKHWSELERIPPEKDIKFIWEPGRFGWGMTLARAYAFSGNDQYAQDFWEKTLTFLEAHPPNLGRQWQSAQEVAVRLMVLVFCDRVFAKSPASTPENRRRLWQAIIEHAQRIPPTLVYARAQNNNHLLSEAAGLLTAGLYFADHPQAEKWRQLGWRWVNWALQNQIDEFGTYVQHSTNYHRLMLQLAVYLDHLMRISKKPWPSTTLDRVKAAVRWLWALTDPDTGLTPNLGANDSAYLFPLTQLPHEDFRPVLDAAAKTFLNMDIYQQPELAEMAGWFEIHSEKPGDQKQAQAPDMLRLDQKNGRAFIHTANFTDRPSHADQLHVDLWWQGVNIAMDPGTYQYNAAPPWDNALVTARVHNTLIFDDQDQMSRAGKFLWLDWAQAEIIAHEIDDLGQIKRVTAEHDGFRKLGVRHQRTLKTRDQGWVVEDLILPTNKADDKIHKAQLSWLLPDWKWTLEAGNQLRLTNPKFSFWLQIEGVVKISLFRAGERLLGDLEKHLTWGWQSTAYGLKQPALMVKAESSGALPIRFQSKFQFE
ncbi:MAG: alginate lyase family protein [Chloroflexota bacterium]|nr:alginate lyase family protein [Chloroflexota bacterium]